MTATVTILKATKPDSICKRYTKRDGKLHKTAVAHVTQGTGRAVQVTDARRMAKVLAKVTASRDLCIVPGEWQGAGAEPFELVTEAELAELASSKVGEVNGGVHDIGGRRFAARLKRGISPSCWLLIDADNPKGIPPEWEAMTLGERLEFLEPLIPGISRCERIELRSSSARVVNGSGTPGPASHAWVRVSDPDRIELLRSTVQISMVTAGKSFESPRYSRTETDKVIGHERRTVIDLSVWIPGRIVFNAKPELGAGMEAYTVADPGITIVNEGGGVLEISAMTLPDRSALDAYARTTGVDRNVQVEADGRVKTTSAELTWETQIERHGECKTLREWVAQMKPGEKLRCEAPFRDSASEAAFIKKPEDGGDPYVHDVGIGTTYTLKAPIEPRAPDGVMLVNGASLKPEPIRWLWSGWLALGKLHILAGAPGQGKTTILLAFAAVVSRGARWPDGSRCPTGNILIWSGEDDPTDTLLPRLLAMGADKGRIYFIKATRVGGDVLPFDPARDMVMLADEARRIGDVRLLVVDPVVSAVAGDSHKNTEVRRALQPIVDLASALDCAAVGVSHFGKGSAGRDPTERVVGSVAFGAVARVVMCAAKVKSGDDEDARLLVRSKSNIGPDGGGFHYSIEQHELAAHPGIGASRIAWGALVEGSARELLAVAEIEPDNAEAEDACGFLRGLLADHPVAATIVFAEASGAGYSRDQMQRAARRLGVERNKSGMKGPWVWALPGLEDGGEGSEDGTLRRPPSSPSSVPSSDRTSAADENFEVF